MKAILVFIDGTICDASGRLQWVNSPDFYQQERMHGDKAVDGSIQCLKQLAERYIIVYIGARPEVAYQNTKEWLEKNGYPKGDIYLGENQEHRLSLVRELKGKCDFIAGIGDRWDDNELHAEIGCASIILQEHSGKWNEVVERIERLHRNKKINENKIHLQGKVEGLARVCPLLLAKYGDGLWEAYYTAVIEMAERSREARRVEDLTSFSSYGLDPNDLRDAARWDQYLREEDWEGNPVYGLQEFELVGASRQRYVHKVTRCYYAELWKKQGRADIGYQVHCRTDMAWWDKPAWNPAVRFEQPKTIMQGDECCLFVQTLDTGE